MVVRKEQQDKTLLTLWVCVFVGIPANFSYVKCVRFSCPYYPNCRKISNNFQTLPKMFCRLPNIAEDFPRCFDDFQRLPNVMVQSYKSRRNLVSLLFRTQTQHLAPFTGLFWVEIEFNFSR